MIGRVLNLRSVPQIVHESDMVVGTMEAKETLDSLIKDREQLMQQLGILESEESADSAEQIDLLKQEIKSRSGQISGLQQKLFNYDGGKLHFFLHIFCTSKEGFIAEFQIYNNG